MRTASVIVRCRNKVDTVERTLAAVRRQTVTSQLIVVDSGSTDGTLEVARRYADELVELPPDRFSYGRALNLGASVAAGDVHFALSAHTVPPQPDWIERSLTHYDRPDVAAAGGATHRLGRPMAEPFVITRDNAWSDAWWGHSHYAGSWRADTWRVHRFDESLETCEDKEWSWRVLAAGWVIVVDPALYVPARHLEALGPRDLWRLFSHQGRVLARMADVRPASAGDAMSMWWSVHSRDPLRALGTRLLRGRRAVSIAAQYAGARQGRRERGDRPPHPAARALQFAHGRTAAGEQVLRRPRR